MEFRLLGPVQVWSGDRPLPVGGTRERRALAALLLDANRTVGVDRLVQVLWGEDPPPTAAAQIRNTMAALRRNLAKAGPVPFERSGDGFVIHATPDELDTLAFDRAVIEARRQQDQGRLAEAATTLRTALDLYRGTALDGIGDVLGTERAALEERRLAAVERRVELDLALGRHHDLVGELARLVHEQPTRERLAELYLLALYRAGRRQDALHEYARIRDRLADEFGLDPRPQLAALPQAILRGDLELEVDTTPDSTGPTRPAAARVDAARVDAARVDAAAGGQPPRPAIANRLPGGPIPAQLPPDVVEFIGREDQRRVLDGLIPTGEAATPAVVAIFGPAGVGKTTLVIHWAHSVADRFPDGQLYIDMRGFSPDPPLVPVAALSRFLRAVGLPADQIPMDEDEAVAAYRTALARRRMLVVVDNARHVEQVRPLLPPGPGCLCVVTSRTRLGGLVAVNGARPLTLDVLSPADSVTLVGRIVGADRVSAEPAATAELAHACGRLPLAVRIAAAQLLLDPDLMVADLVAALRPGHRLAALSIPGDRQASIRAAFDCSYQTLESAPRRTLRLLGAAPGADFGVAAVAVLAGLAEPNATAALDRLAGAHLVERVGGRYALHDLVREYATALPETTAGETAAAVAGLLAWQLRGVEAAMSLTSPPAVSLPIPDRLRGPVTPRFESPAAALSWLDDERANLVEAIRYAAGAGQAEVAWLLAGLLRGYFRRGMHTSEWILAAQLSIEVARDAPADLRPRVRGVGELSLGVLHQTLGRQSEAVAYFTAAVAAARESGWLDLEASVLGNLGVMAWRAGDLAGAVTVLRDGVDVAREAGNVSVEANNLGNLAVVSGLLGRLEEAATSYRKLIPLFRNLGARDGEAHATSNLADVSRLLGRFDEAIRHGTRAAGLFREIGDAQEASALVNAAAAHSDVGQFDEAARMARAALAIARAAEHRYMEVDALEVLAYACRGQGDTPAALAHAEHALRLAVELDSADTLARVHCRLAETLLSMGRPDDAEAHAAASLALAEAGDFRLSQAEALILLAAAASARQQPERATECARRASAVAVAAGLTLLADRAHAMLTALESGPGQCVTHGMRKTGVRGRS